MPILGMLFIAAAAFFLILVSSPVLLFIAHLIVPKGAGSRTMALILSFAFPMITAGYFILAFFINAFIAEMVGRPMDYGDFWIVAINNGYRMEMIDSTDKADITLNNEHVISDIIKIELISQIVIGETSGDNSPHFFLLNTATKQLLTFKDEVSLKKAAKTNGIFAYSLQTPEDFYDEHRSGRFEWWTSTITLAVPVIGFCWLISYLIKLRKRAHQFGPIAQPPSPPV